MAVQPRFRESLQMKKRNPIKVGVAPVLSVRLRPFKREHEKSVSGCVEARHFGCFDALFKAPAVALA